MRTDAAGESRPRRGRPHIVALCGSRREGSYTHRALDEALAGASEAGATTELVDLAELELPPLDPDNDDAGDGQALRQAVTAADAVLLGTPMYHGSYSGVLKNALDYCGFDEFEDATVGLLAVSGGPFPTPALEHLRSVCRSLRAWVLPHQAAVPKARGAFDETGFRDGDLRSRVRTLGKDAVANAIGRSEPVVSVGEGSFDDDVQAVPRRRNSV